MKGRIASIAFLLGALSTGIAWLTLQPSLVKLMGVSADADIVSRVRGVLPFYLTLDLIVVTLLVFLILYVMLGRPLRRTEETIDQLGRLELPLSLDSGGGPLLS